MCHRCLPGLSRRGALIAAALLPGCLATGPARAEALVMPRLRLAASASGPPRVALTLDACSGRADLRVLGGLIRLGLPATVFATGLWLRANPDVVALLRERADLFSLQNHGARHVPAVLGGGRLYGIAVAGSIEAVRAEVAGGADAIIASGAPPPAWFRGATALYSPAALAAIRAMGFRVAGFSLNGDEGASLPAARVAARIAAARDGDVVIAHTNHPERPSGPGVVEGAARLADRGVRLVRLDLGPVRGKRRAAAFADPRAHRSLTLWPAECAGHAEPPRHPPGPAGAARRLPPPARAPKHRDFKPALARATPPAVPGPARALAMAAQPALARGPSPGATAVLARPADPRPLAEASRPWTSQVNAEFRQRIAAAERSAEHAQDGYGLRNPSSGALGRYQFVPMALRDIGWMDAEGGWTEAAARHGVTDEAGFLASPAAQEAAMTAFLARQETILDRGGSLAAVGETVTLLDGTSLTLTEGAMVAAAHRRGAGTLARYLAHRRTTPDAPLTPAQRSAFDSVEARLRGFAEVAYVSERPASRVMARRGGPAAS